MEWSIVLNPKIAVAHFFSFWIVVGEIKQFVNFTWKKHSFAFQEWPFIKNNETVLQNRMALFLNLILILPGSKCLPKLI